MSTTDVHEGGHRPVVGVTRIRGKTPDPYQPAVEKVYGDSPAAWKMLIGESLWFQFGVYDDPFPESWTPERAGRRYFERQLELAHLDARGPRRVLDVGCGWGAALAHLAERFPHCPRLDAIDVNSPQLDYSARRVANLGFADRVNLYLCNSRDIGELPDPDDPYDLAVLRGVITHLTPSAMDESLRALAGRMRAGGTIAISENFYTDPPESSVDYLATGNGKTVADLTRALDAAGFALRDLRELPSAADAVRWLGQVRENIETRFPPEQLPPAFAELREHIAERSRAFETGEAAVYSVIATRARSRR